MIRRKIRKPLSCQVREPAHEIEDAVPDHSPQHDNPQATERGRGRPLLRGRRRAACTALSVAGIALLLAACSSVPDSAPVPIGTLPAAGAETAPGTPTAPVTPMAAASVHGSYVALGDSYAAGPDIPYPTGPTGGCGQSNSSYPYSSRAAWGCS